MSESACSNTSQQQCGLPVLKPGKFNRPRPCEHIKANGEFCGSPALRDRNYCYFHLTHIGRRLRARRNHANGSSPESGPIALDLPPFEDADSIQIALMQVVDAILHNRIDTKRAGLVLYALQTATQNLANGANFEQPAGATVAGSYDDFEDDFQLADHAAELRVDAPEEELEEEQGDAQAATAQVEAGERVIEKTEEPDKHVDSQDLDTLEDDNDPFECHPAMHLMCMLMGPLAERANGPQAAQRRERDAASQRLEMLPLCALEDDKEEAA